MYPVLFLDVTLKQYLGSFLHPVVSATGSDTITIAIIAMKLPRIPENHGGNAQHNEVQTSG